MAVAEGAAFHTIPYPTIPSYPTLPYGIAWSIPYHTNGGNFNCSTRYIGYMGEYKTKH